VGAGARCTDQDQASLAHARKGQTVGDPAEQADDEGLAQWPEHLVKDGAVGRQLLGASLAACRRGRSEPMRARGI
jgi:hypothetical protein